MAGAKSCPQFWVQPLGGVWTERHKGVSCDAVAAEAVGKAARLFGRRCNLGIMTSYSYALYTESNALILARCWVEKMQFFWDIAGRGGGGGVTLTASRRRRWEPSSSRPNSRHWPRAQTGLCSDVSRSFVPWSQTHPGTVCEKMLALTR